MTVPTPIRLAALHHAHFAVPDLDGCELFCLDFGLSLSERRGDTIYFRGVGTDRYSFIATKGAQTRLIGLALIVDEEAELNRAVSEFGASPLRNLPGPGGGVAVTLHDPDNNPIDLVCGIEPGEALALRPDLLPNTPHMRQRLGKRQVEARQGPASVIRFGHIGLFASDVAASADWYGRTLGLLLSDGVVAGPNRQTVAAFLRMNRGSEFVDHHTIALFPGKLGGPQHLSFEVQDFEAQCIAHDHMARRGWNPVWGMGRHALGSHVFDCWWEPNELRFETFSDTDLHDAAKPGELHPAGPELTRWGPDMPMEYIAPRGTPGLVGGAPA